MIKKTLNADFPRLPFLTGYLALCVGAGMTMLVQSSSVFTSALTPLVGLGVIRIERVYPITLGSNIGTTATGLLAAMAASGDKLPLALQIALCHLFFNISGILIFYPVPFMRVPIRLAKMMGNTTAKYRWFAALYLFVMFFLLPGSVFALSLLGMIPMLVIFGSFMLLFFVIIVINILQRKKPEVLCPVLRTWRFLPEFLRSFEPMDRALCKARDILRSAFPCCRQSKSIALSAPGEYQSKTQETGGLCCCCWKPKNTTPQVVVSAEDSEPAKAVALLLEPLTAVQKTATGNHSNCDSGVSSYASSMAPSLANSRYPSIKNLRQSDL